MAQHTHRPEGPVCDLPTKKACDDRYADWQAMQQVQLAYRLATGDRVAAFSGRRGDKTIIGQLVRVLIGEQETLLNADGNPSEAPWSKRLLAAIERVKAGDLPRYTLYTWPDVPAPEGGTMPHPDDVAPATEQDSKGGSDLRAERQGIARYAPDTSVEPEVKDEDEDEDE